MPRVLVWYIVGNWIAQWQNDIFVWENKKVIASISHIFIIFANQFANRPVLVKGDGPMNKQRRWLKQFYPSTARTTDIVSHAEICSSDNSRLATGGAGGDAQW